MCATRLHLVDDVVGRFEHIYSPSKTYCEVAQLVDCRTVRIAIRTEGVYICCVQTDVAVALTSQGVVLNAATYAGDVCVGE